MSDTATKAPFSLSLDFSANFDELLHVFDQEFAKAPLKSLERFCFAFEGVDFEVRRNQNEGAYRFLVTAAMGYMPYSIESVERREAIKAIIISSRALPTVRFGVDTSSKISACAAFSVPKIVSPDFIFYPLMLFLQEARPFIALIGRQLYSKPKTALATPEKTG